MQAIFYYNSAEPIVIDKTNYLHTKITEDSVFFKDDTELINPTLIVESNKALNNINYVYIGGDIKRYYFINNINYSQGRIELECGIDVLMSHKEIIYKNEFIVWRNQTVYNRYLTDDRQVTEAASRILTFPFKGGDGTFTGSAKKAQYILTLNGRSTN